MKNTAIVLGLLISLSTCTQNKPNHGTLTGILENIKDGTVLNLIDIDSGKVYQKITVQDGKFKTSLELIKPRFFGIWQENPKYDKDRLFLWLENSEIKISGNFDYFVNARIEGSKSNEIYSKYFAIEKDFKNKSNNLNIAQSKTINQATLDSIHILIEQASNLYKTELVKFYSSNIENEVAFYFLVKEMIKYKSVLKRSDVKKLFVALPKEFKTSNEGKLLENYISMPEIPRNGDKFIDIAQVTPEGKSVKISDHLGKFTILDFWSSGCSPCIWEHQRLKNLYNRYHDKGLNIIGISGDETYHDWIGAIKRDSIPWINISDLKGWYNKAFLVYGVKYTPYLILLNEKGLVIDDEFSTKWIEDVIGKKFKNNGL
jgi:thiol-disulfide isomerase/thioredoxin